MKIKSLFIAIVLVTAFLCFGSAVNAQAIDVQALIAQLRAQIQSLLQQISELQAQQGTTQTWCHTFNNNLGVGNTGDDVTALYTVLTKEGIISQYDSPGSVRMQFYEENASSVIKFQAKYGIIQTGYVGPLTRAKLNSLYGCAQAPVVVSECQTQRDCQDKYANCYYSCSSNKCVSINTLVALNPYPDCSSAVVSTCIPNWKCIWGPCVNGYQGQVATDYNNCGQSPTSATINCSALSQVCVPMVTYNTPTSSFYSAAPITDTTTTCITEGNTGTRVSTNNANNCCAGLQEQDIAQTNSYPASILYQCVKSSSTNCIGDACIKSIK